MSDIPVAPISETKNYGGEFRLSSLAYLRKGERVIAEWESHDGTMWTGKIYRIVISPSGAQHYYSDGTTEETLTPKFGAAGVTALIDHAKLLAVGSAKAR